MCLLSTWLLGICSGTRSSWDSSPPARCKKQSPCHLSSSLFSLSFSFSLFLNVSFLNVFFLCLWPTWHLYLNCLPRKSIALPLSSLLGEPVQGFFRWKILHICKVWFTNIERFFDKCIYQRVFSSTSFLPGSTIPLKRPLSKRHPLKMPI